MSHLDSKRRKPAAAPVLVLLLACIVLAACGSTSKSSSTSTNASAATTTTGATGPKAGRFAAMRECLQKNGITLPKPTPGKRPGPGAGGFLGGGGRGGPQLPAGVTHAKYEAAIKKCGGSGFASRGGTRFSSPAFKAALAKFATCLRQNGVNVPTPNTSGKGPVFNTKGINTSSAQFRTAESKCRSALVGAFRRGPGAGGPSGGSSGAPSGGGAGAASPAG